jgi:phage tail sheath protein FI
MPEYLAPGVYIEEISGIRPIEGVGTSTAGFAGPTERGPEFPILASSWLDYQRWFGGYLPDGSYMARSVQGFFENGGQRCFIARIVSATAGLTVGARDNIQIAAVGRGEWGNRLMVKVDRAGQNQPPTANQPVSRTADWFRITVLYYARPLTFGANGVPTDPTWVDPTSTLPADLQNPDRARWIPDLLEVFDNLSHEPGSPNDVTRVVNSTSRLIRVWWDANGAAALTIPAIGMSVSPSPVDAGNVGDGAAINLIDYAGVKDRLTIPGAPSDLLGVGRGLAGLEMIDEVALLMAPDEVSSDPNLAGLTNSVLNQCIRLKDRFAVLSVQEGQGDAAIPGLIAPLDTSYGAIYYPWIRVQDPTTGPLLVPPTGHVAGIYARTDIERGVHKAPANEVVQGILTRDIGGNGPLEFPISKGTQDILNPRGINCIRDFRSDRRSIRVWGARTMASDGEWKYVNVRRLFIYVEESIDEGTQWVVFEPNSEETWAKVRRSIGNFLTRVWRSGALMGATVEEAFFIKCDRTTMTQDDIDNGRLICYIGMAPVKPAEFVIFRFSQKTADAPA